MALPRVAILGGGVGAVTTAFELSKPGWQQRFGSITVYQQGWRLGGKGASGRGPGLRIEEHGLHIWFGFYENAFRMLHRCHQELDERALAGQPRWPLPFTNVEESFRACTEISLADHDGCSWGLWTADFFDYDDDRPWLEPDPRPPGQRPDRWSVASYGARCLHLAADLALSLTRSEPGLEFVADPLSAVRKGTGSVEDALADLWPALGGDIHAALDAAARALDALAAESIEQPLELDVLDVIMRALEIVGGFLRRRYDHFVRGHPSLRRAWHVIDLMIAIVRGLIEDGVIVAESFDVVNGVDFRNWLLGHGAQRESVESALVRTIVYDLAFAYRGGDPQRPAAEAGTALRGLLRTFFTYRGALMWKMNAGMGDVVFAPLYELLVKRGVEVRFFHRVEEMRTAGGSVAEIELDVQAALAPNTQPEHFVRPTAKSAAGATVVRAVWPNDPEDLLTSSPNAPKLAPESYESWFADRGSTRIGTTTLRRGGANDGFELVVFGLPIACVPLVAPDLAANSPRWQAAVGSIETVATQAMQLWLNVPVAALCDAQPGVVVGGFVEPFDTWADMEHLVAQEHVAGAATVAYFCNVLADSPQLPKRGNAGAWLGDQQQLVRAQAMRFLKHDVASLWPKATQPLTREMDWNLLVAPAGTAGEARLDAQYLRANVEPSERYVLSVPGSSKHRLAPDGTGYENLYAVGDWTACTLDAGCVEAAVISGLVAANAIHRSVGDVAGQVAIIGAGGP